MLNVAVLQLHFKDKRNKIKKDPYEVLDHQLNYLCKLKKNKLKATKLVVFHDEWLVSARGTPLNLNSIFPVPSEITEKICDIAKKLNIYISFRLWEKGEKNKCIIKDQESDHNVYDTAILVDDNGLIALKYRRSHFIRGYTGGDKIEIVRTSIGNIGLLLCDELLVPELPRYMCSLGAQIIIVFHGFRKNFGCPKFIFRKIMQKRMVGTEYENKSDDICESILWSSTPNVVKMAYARSYENYACIIGAHSVGKFLVGKHSVNAGGQSFISVPYKKISLAPRTREKILMEQIEIEQIARIQKYVLNERKPTLFKNFSKQLDKTSDSMSISNLIAISDNKK